VGSDSRSGDDARTPSSDAAALSGPPPVRRGPLAYAAFLIYSESDAPFVEHFLLPVLSLDRSQVLLCTGFTPGAALVGEIERGVTTSAVTIAVLSPAYLRDRWARFTDELAGYASGTDARLVPLMLAACDVPLALRFRVMLDFTDRAHWEEEGQRLRDFLGSASTKTDKTPPPPPQKPSPPSASVRWPLPLILSGLVIAGLALGFTRHAAHEGAASTSAAPSSPASAPVSPAIPGSQLSAGDPAPEDTNVRSATPQSYVARPPSPGAVRKSPTRSSSEPDPSWSGRWTTRVSGASEYSEYAMRVVGDRVVIESASAFVTTDAGIVSEPLRIVSQNWDASDFWSLQWTVSRAPFGPTRLQCRLEADHSMRCGLLSPETGAFIPHYVMRHESP
jgi:hypothetical protein